MVCYVPGETQVGGHLTSKRLGQFLKWAALEHGARWVFAAQHPRRLDPDCALGMRLRASLPKLAKYISEEVRRLPRSVCPCCYLYPSSGSPRRMGT